MSARFRTEVVGSLLRPASVKAAHEARADGDLAPPEFKRIEDAAVDGVIEMQERVGLDVISDGEIRRGIFVDSIAAAIDGVNQTDTPGQQVTWHAGEEDQEVTWTRGVTEKVSPRRSIVTEEYAYARGKAKVPVKVTLPSPMTLALLWHPVHTPEVYPDPFDFFADLNAIVRREVELLVELGCTYVQIDAPDLAKLVDEEGREFYRRMGAEPDRILTDGIDLLNEIPAGIDGVTFGMHLCRGNSRGRWRSSGAYDSISKQVFGSATAFDEFLLEYDDERSGGFEPLADLPDDKVAVLGLVTTKRPELEDADVLVSRIEAAAKHHPLEQIAISPQCGFASELAGNPLGEDDQEAKLKLICSVAQTVWG